MRKLTRKLAAGLLTFSAFALQAQYTPQYQQAVNVTEPFNMSLTDYPALLIVDTQTPISNGRMQANGEDIRFGDCGQSINYDYWIESGINTAATRIWVRIPQLLPSATLGLEMYYGDATASGVSNFNTTFPTALITSGNITLSGTQHIGWLQVQAGDTLFVTAGSPLSIVSGYARIDGVVMAVGAGNTAPGLSTIGNGTGGGTISVSAGSGGGSYGGVGGTGGYDPGDTPGSGGPVYGTTNGYDIAMGSGGGSSDNTLGGNGGGAFALYGNIVHITGVINADGNDGAQPGGSRGGGGGSGGGVLVMADSVMMTGAINVRGGDGSPGTNTANDSGAGGAGGRSKLFSDAGVVNTGTTDASGGIGGPYGAPPATNGAVGTVFDSLWNFSNASVGPMTILLSSVSYAESNNSICVDAAAFTLSTGNPAGGTYTGAGVSGNSFDPAVAGAGTHTITYVFTDSAGCSGSDTSQITVNAPVTVTYSEANDTVCADALTFGLTAGAPTGGAYSGNSVSGTMFDPVVAGTGTHDVVYTYTDAGGCTTTDTSQITVSAPVAVTYSEVNDTVCAGASAFGLTAGAPTGGAYSGNGVSGTMFDPVVAGTGTHDVVYTYTNAGGCTATDTSLITVNASVAVSYTEVLDTVCSDDSPYTLTSGTPAGGAYSGNGVSGNSFDPATAGVGTHTVLYTVIDVFGCSGTDTAQITVDACLGIQSAEEESNITVFPNPASDNFMLSFSFNAQNNMQLRIVNTLGAVVVQKNISGANVSVDTKDLAPGMYIVNLILDNGIQKSTRLMIRK